jgi:hypothetical protein
MDMAGNRKGSALRAAVLCFYSPMYRERTSQLVVSKSVTLLQRLIECYKGTLFAHGLGLGLIAVWVRVHVALTQSDAAHATGRTRP